MPQSMSFQPEAPEKFEIGEDATKYGEFISSYFAWITPEEQKKKVEKLQEITEEGSKNQGKRK